MLTTKEVTLVMETLLSPHYMNDEVKVAFRASRKTILLLAKTIELGLTLKNEGDQQVLFSTAGESAVESVNAISGDLLNIAGLSDMYQKMQSLQSK